MSMTTIPTSDLGKGLQAISWCVTHPMRTARSFSRGLAQTFREKVDVQSPLPSQALGELIDGEAEVILSDFEGRNGNVSLYELLVISSIVHARQPQTTVEIGTFDGRTTLQIAKNSPADAHIYTLDLPPDPSCTERHIETEDVAYIEDAGKQVQRKYERKAIASKITQWLGDSASFEFENALDGRPIDFAFIDGSHSYEYIKNDTERILELMSPGGVVLWHDYAPAWPGVIKYLGERSHDLPLVRITGTSLVCLQISKA